jgi:hypothetical protein
MVVENTKEFARAFNAEILLLRIVEDIPIWSAPLLAIDKPWIAKIKEVV